MINMKNTNKTSKILTIYLLSIHILGLVVITKLICNNTIKIALTIFIILNLYLDTKRDSLKKSQIAIRHANFSDPKHWELELNNGHRIFAKIISPIFITNTIFLMHFEDKYSKKKYKMVLTRWDIPHDTQHKLKFFLRNVKL